MNESAVKDYVLPPALIGRADLARLLREIESIDNELGAQKVRNRGTDTNASYHMPTMSRSLSDFIDLNEIDLSDDQGRMVLSERLRAVKDKAPVVHMTFAVDADPDFLQKLVGWIRTEVHPQALISVGLQPALIGGVYIRTPNHVHDFSLKALMQGKRNIIVNEFEGLL